MKEHPIFILARNYQQFSNFCRFNGLIIGEDVQYIGDLNHSRGIHRNSFILCIGNWCKRSDSQDIINYHKARGLKIINYTN